MINQLNSGGDLGNDSTVRGDGGSKVGEVRASTTSPMPEHKGFTCQVALTLTVPVTAIDALRHFETG